ncbi:Hypp8552 [Branchiostoma lanceolatum]|uniref:Hypp8552 protein n=1 Tax=Branchiostoma lanceolatum TaxID=7740 RepID=A0A8K0EI38_BRALA|nr:Hypp8552 [Branchiostoma lanceolatum]
MPSNIEIKARVDDVTTLHKLAAELSQSQGTQLVQEDTFFCVPRGRLKLRHLKDCPSELISYDRPDRQGPKESVFNIAKVQNPEEIKVTLAHALGIRGIVRKQRTLYLVGQTRIHVDNVEKLGHYMELEVMMQPDQSAEDGEQIANELMKKLGIKSCDLMDTAYIDMLEPASQNTSH